MSSFIGKRYRAQGKLLLTGEYFVLDGALALALPTKLGQRFEILESNNTGLTWESYDRDGNCWFSATYAIPDLEVIQSNQTEVALRLQQILRQAFLHSTLSTEALSGCNIQSHLEFSRHWGLGSSSTLISFLADLTEVNPYQLLETTFGGSGYDLACAQATGPILYQNKTAQPVQFQPAFAEQLYFVYLGKKQNSREGIQRYRALGQIAPETIEAVSQLTHDFLDSPDLDAFESNIIHHETLVAKTLSLPRAQELWFADFWGQIKSLGAWGGDFVLATSNREAAETKVYFHAKGFDVVLPYAEMVL
ncbi:GYDIA family GHMP kinase [Haliscomenobacter sp.]|uniref:GYDIA family GHMP kinase n=1 Tax=Haliscomenobacter sp. TaxID=2717303 RepID=UPI003364BB55